MAKSFPEPLWPGLGAVTREKTPTCCHLESDHKVAAEDQWGHQLRLRVHSHPGNASNLAVATSVPGPVAMQSLARQKRGQSQGCQTCMYARVGGVLYVRNAHVYM